MMSSLGIGEFVNTSNTARNDYAGVHEHTDSGLGDQDYAYSSERWQIFIYIYLNTKQLLRRSSDSAKYTKKSSETSVLSGNFSTSSLHPKFYLGNINHESDRQSPGNLNISTAPVHKKVVANIAHYSNNHNTNRFINNNTQTYRNHCPLSLNHHNAKFGVGSISTITSPYAGNGAERVFRLTKSDVGTPLNDKSRRVDRRSPKNGVLYKTTLPLVHSESSIYETTFTTNDVIINNNLPTNSAITFSKTDSKLLYTNKHRKNNSHSKITYDNVQPRLFLNNTNTNKLGPLIYKNSCKPENWKHSTYDNPIRSVSTEEIFEWNTFLWLPM